MGTESRARQKSVAHFSVAFTLEPSLFGVLEAIPGCMDICSLWTRQVPTCYAGPSLCPWGSKHASWMCWIVGEENWSLSSALVVDNWGLQVLGLSDLTHQSITLWEGRACGISLGSVCRALSLATTPRSSRQLLEMENYTSHGFGVLWQRDLLSPRKVSFTAQTPCCLNFSAGPHKTHFLSPTASHSPLTPRHCGGDPQKLPNLQLISPCFQVSSISHSQIPPGS
jgi:hypothetical protein